MDLILKGIVTGLILSFMIGPVFFVLLETSIRKGVKAGIAFDIGVLLSDVIYIIIAYVFYQQVADLSEGQDNSILKLIGGSLFIFYGIYTFFKEVKDTKVDAKVDPEQRKKVRSLIFLGIKGFLLNVMNPLVVFYWFSVMTLGAKDAAEGGSTYSMILFLSCILITFFSIDLLKIFGAKKLRPLVTHRVLKGLNRLVGIVFVVFSIILIYQGVAGLVTK